MQMVQELAEVHDAIEKYKDGAVYFWPVRPGWIWPEICCRIRSAGTP
jgi:hypothetical protein